ncbi:MAG: hypothetical protein BWZ02_02846 [Lentisphaerae bacterium ADurb.BinA184]|nr:MAG: hypothetical protein BWZ02_02846 [Lentisphaerae bacterium ADurb.BinA184]
MDLGGGEGRLLDGQVVGAEDGLADQHDLHTAAREGGAQLVGVAGPGEVDGLAVGIFLACHGDGRQQGAAAGLAGGEALGRLAQALGIGEEARLGRQGVADQHQGEAVVASHAADQVEELSAAGLEEGPAVGLVALHAHGLVEDDDEGARARCRGRQQQPRHEQDEERQQEQAQEQLEEVSRDGFEGVGGVAGIEEAQRCQQVRLQLLALDQMEDDRHRQPGQPDEHPRVQHGRKGGLDMGRDPGVRVRGSAFRVQSSEFGVQGLQRLEATAVDSRRRGCRPCDFVPLVAHSAFGVRRSAFRTPRSALRISSHAVMPSRRRRKCRGRRLIRSEAVSRRR